MRKREPINWKDGVSALVLLALSFFICFGSLANLSYGSYHRPGPGFLPFWTGLLIGLMSLGLLVKSVWQGGGVGGKLFQGSLRRPLYALLALLAYGLLLVIFGYFICNLLFMIFMILLMEKKKWYVAVGSGLITALAFYGVFSVWLQVPLPRGILF
jgi:putative tricarboxylic transport membrane protein